MVGTLAIGGGVLYVGYRVYQYIAERPLFSWRRSQQKAKADRQKDVPPAPSSVPRATAPGTRNYPLAPQETQQLDQYGLITATLSLGVTTAGALFFPPLHFAGVPLLIFMGIPSAQKAYEALRYEGSPTPALAETSVLAVCLSGGYYLVGSLGFSLYYAGRTVLHRRQTTHPQEKAWTLPKIVRLQKDGDEVWTPLHSVQHGDLVLVRHGEMVPVHGTIQQGDAILKSRQQLHGCAELVKRVGDTVSATDIVQVGRIVLQVQMLPLPDTI